VAKAAFKQQRVFLFNSDLNLREKLVKCCIWSTELYGDKTWTRGKIINTINVLKYDTGLKDEDLMEILQRVKE
jgi:hypothetical protein